MRTYSKAFELAVMSARCARCASTKQVAQELWKMAKEYQAEAAKLGDGRIPDLGSPPRGAEE
jgi:histidinol-phosphate/aromatic aminotransferase/cobyric acid decarboxylase-like protein